MNTIDSRLAKVEAKVDIIMSEISGWRIWMFGTALAIFFGFLGVLLRMDPSLMPLLPALDRIETELRITFQ